MKNMIKLIGFIALAAIMGLTLAGCGGSGGGPTGGNLELSGTITISPNTGVTINTKLTATYSGSEAVSFQWKKDGANVGTATTTNPNEYTPIAAGSYTVTVSATDYNPKISSAVTVTDPGLPELTGSVTINGTAAVGQTLTAVTTSLDGDGTITYQWKRSDGTVIGTNSSTYQVATADIGATITVTVTRAGYSGSKESDPTLTVTDPSLPALNGSVTISGTAAVGQTLTAIITSLSGTGNVTYQWKRSDGTVIGTNSNTYQIVTDDIGATITVTVTRAGYSGSKEGGPTAAVTLPALTGSVTIDGTAEVGQILTAVTTSLDGDGTITYQWKRGATDIGTDSTYIVKEADIGSTITVTVTRAGYSGSKEGGPTATVPELSGTVSITISPEGDATLDDPDSRIIDGVLTLRRGDEPVTLTLADGEGYDSGSIRWKVQNTGITRSDSSFTLDASNPVYQTNRIYFITVEAFRNGIPYDFTISFTITEEE
jgi:hypothetical protein